MLTATYASHDKKQKRKKEQEGQNGIWYMD
jgi:hypothetical protein